MGTRAALIKAVEEKRMREDLIAKVEAKRASESGTTLGDKAQTLLESYGNTATGGYLPQIQAAVEPAFTKAMNVITGQEVPTDESYVQRRDENIKRQQAQAARNPIASGIGTAAGIGAQLLIPGGAATKGVTTLGRLGRAAATGAAYGAAVNPGDIEGEISPLQLEERAKGAAKGAAYGAAAGVVGKGLEKGAELIQKVPGKLKAASQLAAFRTLKARRNKLLTKVMEKDQSRELGQTMLDKGLVKSGASIDDIAAGSVQLKEETGEEIGKIVIGLDAFSKGGSKIKIAKSLQDKLIPPELKLLPGSSGEIAKYNAYIDDLLEKFQNKIPLREAQEIKVLAGNRVDWNRMKGTPIPPDELFYKNLNLMLGDLIETEADKIASLAQKAKRGTGIAERYRQAKKEYGNLTTIAEIAKKSAGHEKTNRMFGLTDTISGGAVGTMGALTGGGDIESTLKRGAVGFATGMIANKLGRGYGQQNIALMSRKAAQILEKDPLRLGKWAKPISDAISRSPDKLARVITIAANDPEFQKATGVKPEKYLALIEAIKKNPKLIDTFQDENLKNRLRKLINP